MTWDGVKQETCRTCDRRADLILWGRLMPLDSLGPRCEDHAVEALGYHFLRQVDQWAVYDLRPLRDL